MDRPDPGMPCQRPQRQGLVCDKYVTQGQAFDSDTLTEVAGLTMSLSGCYTSGKDMLGSDRELGNMLKEDRVADRLKQAYLQFAHDNRGCVDLNAFWPKKAGGSSGKSGSKTNLASYYEYKALKQQGYNASKAYDLMKQFRSGVNPNNEFVFHFTTMKGGKGITDIGGIYGSKSGV